jgi:hypothetical protein
MKIAIMQPYFFPYIGYFQLINSVDEFIIYDNIQYSKGGWINRNRILVDSKDDYLTLPLKKDSDLLNVDQRFLADTWQTDRKKMLNKVFECYRKAPYLDHVYPFIEKCLCIEEKNLFKFVFNSIKETLLYLTINTKITVSSTIGIDHELRSEDKVLEICKAMKASYYINPIGGLELYNRETFNANGINLQFQKSNFFNYHQFKNEFVPWLSIIDVLMFNSKDEVKLFLNEYKFV